MPDSRDQEEARAALADVSRQRAFVAERFAKARWLHPVVGLVMGLAAASLAFHNIGILIAAVVVYLVGLVYASGTPAQAGIVPRDNGRSIAQVFIGAMVLLAILALALTGQQFDLWWLSVLAGVLAALAVIRVGRWRLTALRNDLLAGPVDATDR